ncbi:multidrug efflux MFS transporter [Paenibacillus stellifer]|uniref:multidrug efflux MFS transporter n=1 Tax=Paenibacillus stellifer TaxID=169760 RepID=UPI00068B9A4E|nr:multidrug efflux MFS transporter [Paenibacillus stellifer]
MPLWKRNLMVCWFGMFVTGIGMSQIAPILPLYIRHLGVGSDSHIAQLSGIAFGVTYIVSAVFSPIWGRAADRFGRKPMLLRASLGMALVIGCMGFAPNVYVLVGLRLLQGVITGYSTACTTLIATQTDKAHAGVALGTLSTANIAGSLLGPLVGGYISESFGMRNVFFITGALMLVAFITTLLFVKETFVRKQVKTQSLRQVWNRVPEKKLTLTLFLTFFMISLANYSVEPVITVYVDQLTKNAAHIALLAGLIFSASGVANMLAAPILGRMSDRVGAHRVILYSLIAAGIFIIPQAFVRTPWELMLMRFLLGLAVAGLSPSVNTLVKIITPDDMTGRIFGFTISAGYLGVFGGSVLGGQIAGYLGVRYVFPFTSALLLLNAVWVYMNVYRKMKKVNGQNFAVNAGQKGEA